ncbi:SURF1 family protein [Celeribacter sp.]|uniref:SURF1 family protein n=1 Tax=Celeribacter sp. TaxID=1890673 RepID=UPI003A8F570F
MRRGFLATVIFGVLGLAVLVNLGLWQLRRLPVKEGEIARIEAMIGDAPVTLPDEIDPEDDKYRPVSLTGEIWAEELHVLVSTRDWGAGFRIISPMVLDDGRRVMVDRGYVPTEAKEAARATGRVEIIGNLHWPQERDRFTPDDDLEANYWYARDVDKMAEALDTAPILVISKTDLGDGVAPLPVTTHNIPNNHLSYAIQWFLFAAVWLGMTSALAWRMRATKRV